MNSPKTTDNKVLELRNVSKTYKNQVKALQNIDLDVYSGEIFGLLGPNGAGKSTLIKIVLTLIHPTQATGFLLGHPLGHQKTLKYVGYLPENPLFPPYLTGYQALHFYAALTGLVKKERSPRIDQILKVVRMDHQAHRKISTYSKGMRQRIGLAQALVHDPQFLILDEPTDGLDPLGRKEFRQILLQLKEEEKTIFLNSHLLGELEMICDRVAILVDGHIKAQNRIENLLSHKKHYEIILDSEPAVWNPLIKSRPFFKEQQNFIELSEKSIKFRKSDSQSLQPLIDILRDQKITIEQIVLKSPSLEDIFLEITQTDNKKTLS